MRLFYSAVGCVVALLLGLLIVKSFTFTAADQKPGATTVADQSVARPAALEEPAQNHIVASPVIDADSRVFFGTGDGSGGYYSKRPGGAD